MRPGHFVAQLLNLGRNTVSYGAFPGYQVGALFPQPFADRATTTPDGPAVNPGIQDSPPRCHLLSLDAGGVSFSSFRATDCPFQQLWRDL